MEMLQQCTAHSTHRYLQCLFDNTQMKMYKCLQRADVHVTQPDIPGFLYKGSEGGFMWCHGAWLDFTTDSYVCNVSSRGALAPVIPKPQTVLSFPSAPARWMGCSSFQCKSVQDENDDFDDIIVLDFLPDLTEGPRGDGICHIRGRFGMMRHLCIWHRIDKLLP